MDKIEVAKNILAKRISLDTVNKDSKLTDLGLDSLDLVEMMLEIEDAIGVEFASDELIVLKTLGDVLELIENKTK